MAAHKTRKNPDLMAAFVKAGGVSTAEIKRAAADLDDVLNERGLTTESPPEDLMAAAIEAFRRTKG